jgi:membrane fusion protein, multidrug efflux system
VPVVCISGADGKIFDSNYAQLTTFFLMRLLISSSLIIGLVLIYGCGDRGRGQKEKNIPELKVMTLQTQDISIPRGYITEINAVQYVEIHARVQGYLEEIFVDEGQLVKKGQPLFRISSNEYKEMVTKAEANLQRAIAEAKTKSLEVDRIKLMVDKNIISKTELDVALAKREAAESGIEEARSVLQNAKINLNYTFITAPFAGVLDRIPFKIGSLINSGTLLTSVSNIDEVFAYFRVSEKEYLKFLDNELGARDLKKNKRNKVSLVLADGNIYAHAGYIETMEGSFDHQTGSIAFRARFANPDKILKHGSSGKILTHRTMEDAVLVPQESTFAIQDKNYVFILDRENIARARSFDAVGRYQKYFVATGLRKGEVIVIEGIQQIRDGVSIIPKVISSDSLRLSQL